ncbi:MAG: DGQHR domain-containing protein [Gracilibacteraceae bacterium]|jgi:DNA sulfur modification protein DndB|nr:DGQHR domain-containing protein [Gracilibacteraceae bacterium]
MKIPAIRAKVGIWVYYVSTLTYAQVKEHVKMVDKELHKSAVLSEMLQRSITNNYKQIAAYIMQQEERFFNSLVLAVYDGDPQWHEIRLDYGDDEEYYDIGLLELTGEEKIFPVDGQHRVEGIKKVLRESDQFNEERIPVIFIGHRNDDDGMKRARRLFSTLNRYAKPVSQRDIIALDEDDSVAIASRELIENHPLFENERILDSKTKAIPENNKKAFTTIITFYECNYELMHLFLESRTVKDSDGRKMRGRSKAREYIRFRPDQPELDGFISLCVDFWNAVSSEISCVREYLAAAPAAERFRNKVDGGLLPFRPAALIPLVKAVVHIHKKTGESFNEVLRKINTLPLKISDNIWAGILWDKNNQKMIMNHQKVVELCLVLLYDPALSSEKEKQHLVDGYASATQTRKEEAESALGICVTKSDT